MMNTKRMKYYDRWWIEITPSLANMLGEKKYKLTEILKDGDIILKLSDAEIKVPRRAKTHRINCFGK